MDQTLVKGAAMMKGFMKRKLLCVTITVLFSVLLCSCGNSYEYINGNVDWYSTYSETKGTLIHDTFYYSDDWFGTNPSKENGELALASMQLAASAVTDEDNGAGAAFLRSMGFEEVGFSGFADADSDGFSYTWGRKTVGSGSDECSLIAVAVQSASFDMNIRNKGWKQNFTVNDPQGGDFDGEHYAYARAVEKEIDGIAALAGAGNVKFWITGQSRGGALTNILAAKLPDKLGDRNKGIFAYTFEAPATADADTAGKAGCKYIHNYVCNDDIVTMIPVWGMTRYGVTHDLRTKKTDSGLTDELSKLGSEAADLKPRIVAEKSAQRIIANFEAKIPERADYSAARTADWADSKGENHKITYSYQEAFTDLMNVIFSGDESGSILKALAAKKNDLAEAEDHLAQGVIQEKSGKDPYAEYWEGSVCMYEVLKEASGDEGPVIDKETLFKILSLAAPVLIEIPEDGSEPDLELLTDVIGYNKELTYSHQFDTLIARLKILAPAR